MLMNVNKTARSLTVELPAGQWVEVFSGEELDSDGGPSTFKLPAYGYRVFMQAVG
ncbi:hypothetical protein D3C73_1610860 [compost metagenome]